MVDANAILYPRPLGRGDRVALLSPASIIKPELVDGAAATLAAWGFEPVVMAHTLDRRGSYAGTAADREADLRAALTDPSFRAVICTRGGYGAVHLLPRLSSLSLRDDPKWIVGFSDISALHALMASQRIASVHASMAKQLTIGGADDPINRRLLSILTGDTPQDISWGSTPLNRSGQATGRVFGGNLAVLADLIATPFDRLLPGTILFIEDIAEPIYKVERILWQLKLSGRLERVAGLIVGQFTEYRPDRDHQSMEAMIADMVAPYGYPVAFNAPIGHVDTNLPIVESSLATLTVDPIGSTVKHKLS